MTATIPKIKVSDVTGLRSGSWQPKPGDSVLALIDEMAEELGLASTDANGQPVVYSARREDGMMLAASELVDDVLSGEQAVYLEPDINAG
jgi:hypothetical protein